MHAAAAKLINPGGFGFGQIPGPSSSLFRRRTKKIYQPSKDIIFQPYVVLCILSRFKIVVRSRARAVYLFSYGISRAEFSLGNRYLK